MRRRLVPITLVLIAVVALVCGIGGDRIHKQNLKADGVAERLTVSNRVLDQANAKVPDKMTQLGLTDLVATDQFKAYVKAAAASYPAENYDEYGCALAHEAWWPPTRTRVEKTCDGWRDYVRRDNEFFAVSAALKLGVSVCRGTTSPRLEDTYPTVALDLKTISTKVIDLTSTNCHGPAPVN